MWVQDPAAGTFQYFVLDYTFESSPTPYRGRLVIDGTHAGLDAIPAGTQVHIEGIEGCDIDRTEVSTGADMEIDLDDLPGGETTCRVRVTITPAEGDEITGSGVYTVEFTAGSPEQVVRIETNDVLVPKTVNFTAFEELVDGSEYASGAARETTMGPEDRPVTGRYQLYIAEIDHTCEVNVVDGIGSVNIDVPEGRTVEVVVTDPVSGEEVGRFNFASGDSTLQVPLVYLARLEPNATVNLDFDSTIGEFGPDAFVAYLQTADGTRVEGTEQIFGLTDLEDGSINFDGIFAANPENLAPITYTLVIESDGDASITTDPEGQTGYGNRLEFDGITFPVQLTPPNPHNVSEVVAAGVRDIVVEVKRDSIDLPNARVYSDGEVVGYTDSFGQTNLRPNLVNEGELDLRLLTVEIAQTDDSNPELSRDDWAEIDSQIFTVNLANNEIPPLVAQFETTVEPSDGDGEEVGPGEDAGEDTGIVDAGNDTIDDADAGTNPDTGGNDTEREDTGLPDTSRPDAGTDAIADVESDGAEAEFEDEKSKRGGCSAAPGGYPDLPTGFAFAALVALVVNRRRRDGTTVEAKAFKLYDGARGDEPLAIDNGNGTFTITEVDPEDIVG